MCGYCRGKKGTSSCIPLWHWAHRRNVVIRCELCLSIKRKCSFTLADFDIEFPPVLSETEEASERRLKATRQRRPGPGAKVQVAESVSSVEIVSGPSNTGPSVVAKRSQPDRSAKSKGKKKIEAVVVSEDVNPPPMVATNFQKSGAVYGPVASPGRALYIFAEDISRYEDAMKNPGDRPLHLANLQIELESIRRREEGELEVIRRLVAKRSRLIGHTLDDMARTIERLGGHPVESSDVEEVDEDDEEDPDAEGEENSGLDEDEWTGMEEGEDVEVEDVEEGGDE